MTTTKEKVSKLDKNLRHKSGTTADKFVETYCPVLAEHAYATRDGSINEMEKTLCHVLGMLIYHKRQAEILGLDPDPRDFVWAYEQAEAAKQEAHKQRVNDFVGSFLPNPQERSE